MNAIVNRCELCSLSQLLPYDPDTKKNGDLRKGLDEYGLLLSVVKLAMAALKAGDFSQFDALVGENACQIRAVKIAMTASQYRGITEPMAAQVIDVVERIAGLNMNLLMQQGNSLKDLVVGRNLDIDLTPDQLFLIQCFILSYAKTVKPPKDDSPLCQNDVVDSRKLIALRAVSKSFADNLLRQLRLQVATASVEFVQAAAKSLNDSKLVQMCLPVSCDQSGPCVPMFWAYKTLLLSAQRGEVPLVMYVKFVTQDQGYGVTGEECLFFRPLGCEGLSYEALVPTSRDLERVAVVVEGVACAPTRASLPSPEDWRAQIAKIGPIDVILSGAADHRQYPPSRCQVPGFEDEEEFQRYQQMARSSGFSLENPGMFFIHHVYPATVGRFSLLVVQATRAEERIRARYI